MSTREERLQRRRMLLALALRPQTPDDDSPAADVADLAAFTDGNLGQDPATRARVLGALARNPAAWRVWRQAQGTPEARAVEVASPAERGRTSMESLPAPRSWIAAVRDRVRAFLGIDLVFAVPVFASLMLAVAFGIRTLSVDQPSGRSSGSMAALIEVGVPDLPQVRAGLASALTVVQATRLIPKGIEAPASDPVSVGFDSGLRAAAGALGVAASALTAPVACTDGACESHVAGGETFGVWAFATVVRCNSDAAGTDLDRSREALADLRQLHSAWRSREALPDRLQDPPIGSASDQEICGYAGAIVNRVLAR